MTDLTAPIVVGSTTVTIVSTDTLSSSSGSLVTFVGGSPTGGTLVNQGMMTETGSAAAVTSGTQPDSQDIFENDGAFSVTAVSALGVDYVTTHNTGTFSVTGTGGGSPTQGADGDVVNSGSMIIRGLGSVTGVDDWNPSPGGVFQNLGGGTFSVSSSGGSATGVILAYGYEFDNAGQITVSAATSGVGLVYGAFIHGNTIDNNGTITVTGASSTGISISTDYGVSPVTVTNTGTITAQVAIHYAGTAAILFNSGVLNGAVVLSGANDAVFNTGSINGDVNLGNGNDSLYSDSGSISGVVTAGAGSSTITLGAENNTVALAAGIHVVDAGGGTNTVSYAGATSGVHVSLALQGLAQNTGVGTDTLFNFQALVGSSFNDTLEGGGSVSGIVTGGLGADAFVLAPGDSQVTVTDFSHAQGDVIDLSHEAGFHTLADVLAVTSQQGADTVITVGGDSLRLQNLSMSSLTATDFIYTAPTVGPSFGGTPTAGSGTLTGTSGDDWLQGGIGGDSLHGGAGSDYLDGGAGLNTATYDGVYRQYGVGTGGATVSGGPEGGTDDLVNIQRIQFVDGYLAVSPTDTAGQVYRLYEAALGRVPDAAGLAGWVHALNAGAASLLTAAGGFVTSAEFTSTYGALDNSHFISLLYQNVLHRGPDQGGLDGWLGYMAQGHSQAEVLLGFSESPEDISDLAGPVQQGLWVGDPNAAEAARLYDTVFGRLPDTVGLPYWTHALDGGMSLQTAANGFVASPEFQAAYAGLDDSGFLTKLYSNVLHRAPDQAGLNGWLSYLAQGHARAEVVLGFSDSLEHVNNTAAHIDQGIWVAG